MMKKILILAVMFAPLAASQVFGVGAAMIQSQTSATSGTTIVSAALPFPATAGNALIGFAFWISGSNITGVTTSGGDTCNLIAGTKISGSALTQEMFYCLNIAGGSSYTATVTLSGSSGASNIDLAEYTGILALDKSAANTGIGGVTNMAIASTTPSGNNELVFGGAIAYANDSISLVFPALGSFRPILPGGSNNGSGSGGSFAGIADKFISTASAVTSVMSAACSPGACSLSGEWALSVAMFTTQTNYVYNQPYVLTTTQYIDSNTATSHSSSAFNDIGSTWVFVFIGTHYLWNSLAVAISGVTDSAGNTYSALSGPTNFAGASFPMTGAIYYIHNPVTLANNVVTIAMSNPVPLVMHIAAVVGGVKTVVSPINSPGAGMTSTNVTIGPITVPSHSLVLLWAKNENPANLTNSAGYYEDLGGSAVFDSNDENSVLWGSWIPDAAGGSMSGAFTYSTAIGWQSGMVAISSTGNTCVSNGTGGGNWHTAGTWTACGSTYPGDGDTATIQSGDTVTINGNVGTSAVGIKNIYVGSASSAGTLNVTGTGAYTINFGSTSSDAIGAGSKNVPTGTMYGIFVCHGSTVDTRAGSATNYLTLKNANSTYPFFFLHNDGGCGAPNGSTDFLYLQYLSMTGLGTNYMGEGSYGYAGLGNNSGSTSGVLLLANFVCAACYYTVYGWGNGSATIANGFITGRTGGSAIGGQGTFQQGPGTITNVCETHPTNGGHMFALQYPQPTQTITVQGNCAWYVTADTPGVWLTESSNVDNVNWLIDHNIVRYDPSASQGSNVVQPPNLLTGATGTSILSNNYMDGGTKDVVCTAFTAMQGNVFVQNSTVEQQGAVFCDGGSGFTVQGNTSTQDIYLADQAGNSNTIAMNALGNSGAGNTGSLVSDQATVYIPAGSVGNVGANFGDPQYAANSGVKNSILFADRCVVNGENTNTFIADFNDGVASVGVHHNNAPCATPYYLITNPGVPQGNGFDDGTNMHPNAIYGDISVTPVYARSPASPTTYLAQYDKYIGGPGTIADLFNGLIARAGIPTGTTAPLAPQALYNPVAILNFIRMSLSPMGQIQFATAGYEPSLSKKVLMGAMLPILIGAF